MANDIAVITSVFNPIGFKQPRQNFERFTAKLEQDGVPWYAIELAFHDDPCWLPEAPNIFHCRSKSVLWHKENLLNVLADRLPPEIKKVIWADCDLLFSTPDWWKKASELLEQKILIQPFETAGWQKPDGAIRQTLKSFGYYCSHKAPGRHDQVDWTEFHPGFAWAARREFFERGGLYFRNILGGADLAMALAFAGMQTKGGWNEKVTECQKAYAESMAWIDGKLGYLPGVTVEHMWHGHFKNRQRSRRRRLVHQFDFDPMLDISQDANGMLQWATSKPEFHEAVYKFFERRKEDGGIWKTVWQSCLTRIGFAGRNGSAASERRNSGLPVGKG